MEYKNAAINWLSEKFEFSFRVDLPTRKNRPYNVEKFVGDLRKMDYKINRNLLGKKQFDKLNKQNRLNDRLVQQKSADAIDESQIVKDRCFFLWVEEGNETKVENHFHALLHLPKDLRGDLESVESEVFARFKHFGYKPLVEQVISSDHCIDYNLKDIGGEFDQVEVQRWGLTYK